MKRESKKIIMLIVLVLAVAVFVFADNLNFEGWYTWGSVSPTVRGNTITLNTNGRVSVAGYVNERLNPELKGRTVILEIQTGESQFSEGRMMKITVNRNDRLVPFLNIPNLIHGEYIPASATLVEFTLPYDFDGKIGFVFYQANLKDLQITATYR